MKWESIKTGQAHDDFVPSKLWAPVHLLLKCFPSWRCFSAFKNIYGSKARLEDVCVASHTKGAVMPPALSLNDSYRREVLQGKMWRLTPEENQGMGRKPSRSAEQREVHFLERGAAISRRACSTANSAPTLGTNHVPGFPGTNNLTIYCISAIPHHLSNPFKHLPDRLQRSATSPFLTKTAHSQSTWYFLTAVFPS